MSDHITAAAIGSVTAISVMLIKDIIWNIVQENRKTKRDILDRIRLYSSPFSQSLSLLAWRLKELIEKRGVILSSQEQTEFTEYKRLSTIYRLSAVIGWLRALRIELSYLEGVKNSKDSDKIETGIRNFESSLADGDHIEEIIFRELMEDLGINSKSIESSKRNKFIAEIDHIRSLYLQTKNRYKIRKDIKNKIVAGLKKAGISNLNANHLDLEKLFERKERWLYRDYQSSIGDFMLKDTTGPRKFNIIGFADFIDKRNQWKNKYRNHIDALDSLFLDINIDEISINDARPQQLRKTFKATVEMIVILSEISKDLPISKNELKKLKEAIQNVA